MSGIFDRLNAEIDQIGDRVRTVFESSKLHLDRSRLVGLRSKAAYKLGMLVYKKERGGEVNQAEIDAVMAQLDDIAAKIAKLDRELDDVHGESVSVDEQPAPAAEPAEAEVKTPYQGEVEPGARMREPAPNPHSSLLLRRQLPGTCPAARSPWSRATSPVP